MSARTPRYTDQARYQNGYRRSGATDIRLTFRRARERIEEDVLRLLRAALGSTQ